MRGCVIERASRIAVGSGCVTVSSGRRRWRSLPEEGPPGRGRRAGAAGPMIARLRDEEMPGVATRPSSAPRRTPLRVLSGPEGGRRSVGAGHDRHVDFQGAGANLQVIRAVLRTCTSTRRRCLMTFGFPAHHTETYSAGTATADLREAARETLTVLMWSVREETSDSILADTPANLRCWGGLITFTADSLSVCSKCFLPTQCVDWGKNKANVRRFLAEIPHARRTDRVGPPGTARMGEQPPPQDEPRAAPRRGGHRPGPRLAATARRHTWRDGLHHRAREPALALSWEADLG